MQKVTLGRTGLPVTVMGVGCGGPSRAGQSTGKTVAESVAVVREALEAGINVVDTSEAYGTEEIVGAAIRAAASSGVDRSSLVLSTKKRVREAITPQDVVESLDVGKGLADIADLEGAGTSLRRGRGSFGRRDGHRRTCGWTPRGPKGAGSRGVR